MKYNGFPIKVELKNFKKLKKLKKLEPQNHPKPSRSLASTKGQQPPTRGNQRQTRQYGPKQSLTVANIKGFLCFSYVYPMPLRPNVSKYQ